MIVSKNNKIFTFNFSDLSVLTPILLLILSVNVGWGQTASYTVASKTSVTSGGTSPAGSSATYSQTFGTVSQMTSGNSSTLTLSGYAGKRITSIVLNMKSNTSAGAGNLSVVAGSTTISSITGNLAFNNASWNGAYSTTYVNVTKTPTAYTIGSGENVVVTISATTNSLYIAGYTIVYTTPPSPTLTASTLSSTISSTYGTASTGVSFTPTGSNLTANITATAQTGFAVSTTLGSGYGASVSVASGTTVYVQSTSTKTVGNFNGVTAVVLSSTGATNVNITTSASGNAVSAKALTISSAAATSKTYDRTTTATITGSLSGIVNSDVVTLSGTGTFAQSDIGTAISVTSTSTLGGAGAGNYSLTQPTGLTANITAKALTVSGASASNKTYDGTNTASISGGSLVGIISPDVVTLSQSGTFAQTIIGTGVSVTSTSTLGGANAGNYTLTQPTGLSANITAKALTISGISASDKTYDGTNTATLSSGSLVGVVSPDVVTLSQTGTFSQSTVGTGLTVTSTSTLGGANAGNYSLTQPSGITASITKATPVINSTPSASDITLGQALSSSVLTSGSATPSGGTFTFSSPATAPTSVGVYSASIIYTPIDVTNYNTVSGTTNVNVNAASTPTLDAITLSSNLSSTYGTASTGISFTPSGLNLSGNITVTAQSGFEVSTSLSSGYSSSISVASGTTVYARFSALKSVGSYNSIVFAVLSSSGASSSNAVTSASGNTISPKALSISSASIASKTYDALATSGTVTPGTLSGFVGSETVTVSSAVGTYSDATVGTGKTATIVYSLADGTNGGLATNYSLVNTTSTGNITSKTLSITAASIASKTYDASAATGTVTPGTLSGFVGSETVTVSSAVGTYLDATIGTGKTATIVYTLANGTNGGLATNYTLAITTSTGNITAKTLSITTASIASKTYDASATIGTVTPGTLSGFVGSETVTVSAAVGTYVDGNVGVGKTATIVYTLANGTNGGLATNYTLANTTATGNITAKTLSITTASIASKTYDASAISGTVTPGTLSGFIGSETVTISAATGLYADANVGVGKTATITYTLANGTNGGLATNYSLASTTANGDITQATQTVTFTLFSTPITANSTITATSNVGGTISYSSSNTAVATINASTGAVIVVSSGTTTITASAAGSSNYTSGTVSQVLTVNLNTASLIAGWDFNGLSNYGASPQDPSTTAANVSVVGLTRISGFGTGGTAATNAWGGTGNGTVTFTVKANNGFTLSLSTINAYNIRRSGSGATAGQWSYSLDGTNFTNIGSSITWGGTTSASGNSKSAIDISGISALQNVTSSTTVTFKIVNSGATTGTWYFNNYQTGDDFGINGIINCATPAQSSSITGNTTVCSSTSQTYSVTNVSGTGYTWSLPVSWTGTSTTNSISATTASNSGSGTISVTPYNAASGCSNYTASSQTISVTNNQTPTISGTMPASRCDAGTVSLGASASEGAVNWYEASTGGTSLNTGVSYTTSTLGSTTTFYVDATSNGCTNESRTAVIATVNSIPSAPLGNSMQSFCSTSSPTIANLSATGTSVQWYAESSGGSPIANSTALTMGNYYASQTVSSCESTTRTNVSVTINSNGTWIGGASGDWNDVNNWCGGIPNSTSTVVSIPSDVIIDLGLPVSVLDLTIGTNSILNAGNNTILIADGGSIANNGTFNAGSGTIEFSGNGSISGTAITFNNLTVDGTLSVTTSPTVNGTVTINNSGSIISNPINYGSSASLVYNTGTSLSTSSNEWPITNSPRNVTIQNNSQITLNSSKEITGNLNLISGVIYTSSTNLLIIGSNRTTLGSVEWTDGTVVGPMKRWFGASANSTQASGIFPVGLSDQNRLAIINFTEATDGGYIVMEYVGDLPTVEDVNGDLLDDPFGLPLMYMINGERNYIQNADLTGYWDITPYSAAGVAYGALDINFFDITLRINSDVIQNNPVTANPPGMRIIRAKGNPSATHDPFEIGATTAEIIAIEGSTIGTDFLVKSSSLQGFSWFNIGGDNETPLPIELLSFTANCNENQTQLIWSTASENNSDYFEILKSHDGENWSVITKKQAAGFSTTLQTYNYSELEKSIDAYYRLNQVDINGSNKLYDPVFIDCEGIASQLTTYPNPSIEGFNILISDSKLVGESTLIIRDAMGKIFLTKSISIESGLNLFPITSIELENGVYFISVESLNGHSNIVKHLKN